MKLAMETTQGKSTVSLWKKEKEEEEEEEEEQTILIDVSATGSMRSFFQRDEKI